MTKLVNNKSVVLNVALYQAKGQAAVPMSSDTSRFAFITLKNPTCQARIMSVIDTNTNGRRIVIPNPKTFLR